MATYGHTFTSGDTVTPTKLNNARTVSEIVNADIKNDAAIAHSKLANIPSGQLLLGNGSNVPTATAVTGDVTISNAGVTAITAGSIVTADLADGAVTSAKIADGAIVNADVNASAAIAGTKILPDFGSQTVTAGQVNIVNNSGDASIEVGGSGNVYIDLKKPNTDDYDLRIQSDGSSAGIESLGPLSLNATTNQNVIIASGGGNVGIGMNSPSVKLDVNGGVKVLGQLNVDPASSPTTKPSGWGGGVTTFDVYASGSVGCGSSDGSTIRSVISSNGDASFTGTVTATAFAGPLTGNVTGNLTGTASAIADGTVSTAKIVDGNVTTAKLATATQQSLVPAGAVMPFAMNSAPSGWLAANGDAVSRSTYAALFTAIGTTHGSGDGSTTFNLPDLRGIFVRGSGSQTISGTTYSGTFADRQQDALKTHTHTYKKNTGGNAVTGGPSTISDGETDAQTGNPSTGTSTETRPANIALLYCIKF